jgi:LmbE family N-acetylglucosaminyl deacetylase
MTPGDCGSSEHSAEEIAAIRRAEAAASAKLIGAEYICGEFRDLSIFSDNESRGRVAAILRKTQPDIVLTSSPVDYLCDHEATSMLVRDACFGAPTPNYAPTGDPPLPGIPHLYFMDPIEGHDREGGDVIPHFVVNVAETFAIKKAMLSCHDSQRRWLKTHHGIDDYLDSMEEWTRKRGKAAGFEFGEGFRRYLGHPYPQTPVLEDLLRAYCL